MLDTTRPSVDSKATNQVIILKRCPFVVRIAASNTRAVSIADRSLLLVLIVLLSEKRAFLRGIDFDATQISSFGLEESLLRTGKGNKN